MNRMQRIVAVLYCVSVAYCFVWIPWHFVQGEDRVRTGYGWVWAGPTIPKKPAKKPTTAENSKTAEPTAPAAATGNGQPSVGGYTVIGEEDQPPAHVEPSPASSSETPSLPPYVSSPDLLIIALRILAVTGIAAAALLAATRQH